MAKKNTRKSKQEKARFVVPSLVPRTDRQKHFINNLRVQQLTFALGPAGTGKTYVSARHACSLFEERRVDKIIVTRPMVSAEEDIGHLPGTAEEKFAPYFAPVREVLEEHLGRGPVEYFIKSGQIELAPIGFLRGHTFKNAFVLFDEAQNTTPKQMQLFLTRIGDGARVCVSGDLDQMDISGNSGLLDALNRFGHLDEVGVTRFSIEDVTRSGLARKIVEGYSK